MCNMTEVVGGRFKESGNMYYFSPNGHKLSVGENVIVETARGLEYGAIVLANKELDESEIVSPLKNVVRKATKEDDDIYAKNKEKEKEALKICEKKIAEFGLEMQLVDVEYTFDRGKILFYFTADGRVDFRDLLSYINRFLRKAFRYFRSHNYGFLAFFNLICRFIHTKSHI